MTEPLTILVTGVGAPGTPGTIKCLRENGEREVRIIGMDIDPQASGRWLCDEFFKAFRPAEGGYMAQMKRRCEVHGVDVVLPQTTAEVEYLSRTKYRKAILEYTALTKVAAASGYAVKHANNKVAVMDVFKMLGYSVPEYQIHTDKNPATYYGGHAVAKPLTGNGSRGVWVIEPNGCMPELDRKPGNERTTPNGFAGIYMESDRPDYIVMEYLPGTEWSVDCYRGLFGEFAVPRKRLKHRSGICTHAEVEMREDLIDQCLTAA